MKYAVLLTLLGVVQIVAGFSAGPFGWLLGWSGVSWIGVGMGYGFLGPRVFGKRPKGSLTWWNVLLLLPYLAVTWLLWHLQRAISREPQHVEVAPGLWLGRRCYSRELPSDVKLVVDLTSEFHEPADVREGRSYRCLPILDACVPSQEAFQTLIQEIADFHEPIYVHCALGHGRSAMVVVAILVARGASASLEAAEQRVKSARPGIKINSAQRALLEQWYAACQRR